MTPIVIATGNPHKLEELRAIFGRVGAPVVSLKEVAPGGIPEPAETGGTFEENATIKAVYYARRTGRVCLADDSGLEVDALGGAPGVISSHYATDGVETGASRAERDAANNARLLREMEGVEQERRTARFVCVMVLAGPLHLLPTSSTGVPPVSRSTGVPPVSPSSGTGVPPVSRSSGTGVPPVSGRPGIERRKRNLPHWERDGATYAVTFRIARGLLTEVERRVVMDACLHWHGVRARVDLVVVMPDHVHMLMHPHPKPNGAYWSLSELLHSIKSYTAHTILKKRGARGPLWQDESYDRLIRNEEEFHETRRYFLLNPVRKGLVEAPGDYPFMHSPEWDLADLAATMGGRPLRAPVLEVERARESHRPEASATGGLGSHRPEACATVFATTWGRFEGLIGRAPRGGGGFGYDPLFVLPAPDTRTSAELASFEKNDMSHRGKAARAMAEELRRLGFAG